MKLIYSFFLLMPAAILAQEPVQQVVGSAGGDSQSDVHSVSWTIGEVVTETFTSDGYLLSQGFHQGNLFVSRVNDNYPFEIELKAYPNPVVDKLTVETDELDPEYRIVDTNGRIVANGKIHSEMKHIDFSGFPNGIYFLQVGEYRTHKIVKQ